MGDAHCPAVSAAHAACCCACGRSVRHHPQHGEGAGKLEAGLPTTDVLIHAAAVALAAVVAVGPRTHPGHWGAPGVGLSRLLVRRHGHAAGGRQQLRDWEANVGCVPSAAGLWGQDVGHTHGPGEVGGVHAGGGGGVGRGHRVGQRGGNEEGLRGFGACVGVGGRLCVSGCVRVSGRVAEVRVLGACCGGVQVWCELGTVWDALGAHRLGTPTHTAINMPPRRATGSCHAAAWPKTQQARASVPLGQWPAASGVCRRRCAQCAALCRN